MTVFDVLSLHKGLSRQLDRAGIKAVDFRFVDLYDDYRKLEWEGYKKTYIVAVLSERHGVSERTVYGAIRRLFGECKLQGRKGDFLVPSPFK